jgi:hypothetical protein
MLTASGAAAARWLGPESLVAMASALVVLVVVLLVLDAQRRAVERRHRLDLESASRERGRQKVGLARALLYELDAFYRHYLADAEASLAGAGEGHSPVVKWVPEPPFPVYAGNAARLGELDEETLEAVIYGYGAAAAYVATLRDYRLAMERVLRREATETAVPEAWLHLARLREELPGVLRQTADLARLLCEITGVPFGSLRIAQATQTASAAPPRRAPRTSAVPAAPGVQPAAPATAPPGSARAEKPKPVN